MAVNGHPQIGLTGIEFIVDVHRARIAPHNLLDGERQTAQGVEVGAEHPDGQGGFHGWPLLEILDLDTGVGEAGKAGTEVADECFFNDGLGTAG